MDKIVQPEDYKYFVENPDSSFSPARNKAILKEVTEETEKFFEEMGKGIDEEMGERIHILSSYGVYRFNKGTKSFDQYAGKKIVDKLIGEKILSRVRVMDSVNRINGNDKYKSFIQL